MGYGGERVSQLPLKDKAFLTFLGQNPPFELRPKTGGSPPIFSWNPSRLISISVGGGQQGWSAFALRSQRSHGRMVSGASFFVCLQRDMRAQPESSVVLNSGEEASGRNC